MTTTSPIRDTTDRVIRTRHAAGEHEWSTLAEFLRERREAGKSFERIAGELITVTGGLVTVSSNTVRSWIEDLEPATT